MAGWPDGRKHVLTLLTTLEPMKRFLPFAALLLCTACLTGCVTPRPPMSEAELEQVLTRDYPGRTAQDVLAAATRLWRLADGDDFRIKPGDNSLVAERDWVFYSQMVRIVGDDSWFPDERWSPGMSWNNIPTRYGTGISALTVDDNEITASVAPGAVGAPANRQYCEACGVFGGIAATGRV